MKILPGEIISASAAEVANPTDNLWGYLGGLVFVGLLVFIYKTIRGLPRRTEAAFNSLNDFRIDHQSTMNLDDRHTFIDNFYNFEAEYVALKRKYSLIQCGKCSYWEHVQYAYRATGWLSRITAFLNDLTALRIQGLPMPLAAV
ncbi:hypothetical protein DL96DRAFT_1823744 [Flagelloscypha sp. PMI_526]|nr:hypothetical protein DL96DRAFT_1823744 [Flagelloscypha sp. PMI_526]